MVFHHKWSLLSKKEFVLIDSIVGSVVECSPATRAARVRFPDDAIILKIQINADLFCIDEWIFNREFSILRKGWKMYYFNQYLQFQRQQFILCVFHFSLLYHFQCNDTFFSLAAKSYSTYWLCIQYQLIHQRHLDNITLSIF